ncbi:MAG TPA: DUF3017 domain-containing protein, partial [Mycobacteriales bacterium]|nr:DUF3017 domain-containing protein [Mycobacteriales bacterium]
PGPRRGAPAAAAARHHEPVKALAVVLAVAGVGLAAVGVGGWWRVGTVVLGCAFCLAAALRLVLSREQLGDLAVRSRTVDATVLLVLGFGLVTLANTIPTGR